MISENYHKLKFHYDLQYLFGVLEWQRHIASEIMVSSSVSIIIAKINAAFPQYTQKYQAAFCYMVMIVNQTVHKG